MTPARGRGACLPLRRGHRRGRRGGGKGADFRRKRTTPRPRTSETYSQSDSGFQLDEELRDPALCVVATNRFSFLSTDVFVPALFVLWQGSRSPRYAVEPIRRWAMYTGGEHFLWPDFTRIRNRVCPPAMNTGERRRKAAGTRKGHCA